MNIEISAMRLKLIGFSFIIFPFFLGFVSAKDFEEIPQSRRKKMDPEYYEKRMKAIREHFNAIKNVEFEYRQNFAKWRNGVRTKRGYHPKMQASLSRLIKIYDVKGEDFAKVSCPT